MDPNNPVVKLCAEGMQAEMQGRYEEARRLFSQAWEIHSDDYEACIAAHYLARQQDSPQQVLRWNEEALARAEAVGDERVADFYPSLYLNLGYSHEQLGDPQAAARFYKLAADKANALPEDRYGDIVRGGAAEGLKRVETPAPTPPKTPPPAPPPTRGGGPESSAPLE